ncbi:hypothetical protein COLO4_36615 [Corchorus olitorius]|uniref:Uncharacterized protein n=1 Tax=Corchorus olitorius TaxID=93759 RepID=A0A1R3G7B0_9ROSI|nr:hypothetical protein COLO4_36615 [Corchorus olitorius]
MKQPRQKDASFKDVELEGHLQSGEGLDFSVPFWFMGWVVPKSDRLGAPCELDQKITPKIREYFDEEEDVVAFCLFAELETDGGADLATLLTWPLTALLSQVSFIWTFNPCRLYCLHLGSVIALFY